MLLKNISINLKYFYTEVMILIMPSHLLYDMMPNPSDLRLFPFNSVKLKNGFI